MKKVFLLALVLFAMSALAQTNNVNSVLISDRIAGTITTNSSTTTVNAIGWATASVTVNGTYAGVTINFEVSDEGTTWYSTTCTRTDVAVQETSEAVTDSSTRAWDCAVFGSTKFRVRASAYTSGTANLGITMSTVHVEPAATVSISPPTAGVDVNIKTNSIANANPCMSGFSTIQGVAGATSGTSSVQLVAISGSTKIYVCSMQVTSVSGTTPTFALRYGTGSACATGTVTTFGPTAALTVGQIVGPNLPFMVTPAGQALCYIQTGTSPVANYTITYVQQ